MLKIINAIKKYDTIIIHGHNRPDGDCWGSQLGLQRILQASFPKKEVYVVGQNCEYCSFLGHMDEVSDDKFNGALSIVVDTGSFDRVSDQRFTLADKVIKIDHHIVDEKDFGDLKLICEEKPACTQIIAEFQKKYSKDLVMTKDAAYALYVGLVTDTGRFRFDSVIGDTMRIAGYLIDFGLDVSEIDTKLSVETLDTLKLKGYVLSNFEMTENGFAYIKITRDVIEKYHVSDEQAASQVSTIGTIDGCPVWALFIEYPGEIRIRLRSRGPEVVSLANKYNGGGHAKACGCKLENWEQLSSFLADADKVTKDFKENN